MKYSDKIKSKWKLKFCPNCIGLAGAAEERFRNPLDLEKLDYQLVFEGINTKMSDIFDDTVLADDYNNLIDSGQDEKLSKLFNQLDTVYFLTSKNMEEFLAIIDGKEGTKHHKKAEKNDKLLVPAVQGNPSVKDSQSEDVGEEDDIDESNRITYHYIEETKPGAGSILIRKGGENVLRACPCCPVCHVVLPLGWINADDYIDIGLISPTSGGKTTLMTSCARNSWTCLNRNRYGYKFFSGCYRNNFLDPNYKLMADEAEAMDDGKVPKGTMKGFGKRKVFLRVSDRQNGKKYIVGIGDIAGEILAALPDGAGQAAHGANFRHCDAFLYLIEPEMFENFQKKSKVPNTENSRNTKEDRTDYTLLSIEKQGEFQKNTPKIKAMGESDSKDNSQTESEDVKWKPLQMYHMLSEVIIGDYDPDELQERMFALVLTKADLLEEFWQEEYPEPSFASLFERDEDIDIDNLDEDDRAMMKQNECNALYYFIKEKDLKEIWDLFPEHSIHLVSPLGRKPTEKENAPDTFEMLPNDRYEDRKPHPIRIADPIVTCVHNVLEIRKNK